MLVFRTRHARSPPSTLLLSLLFVYCCLLVVPGVDAVNVGESDVRRHLLSAASGSGAALEENACPTATTLEVANATAASSSSAVKITTGSSDGGVICKSEVVKSAVITVGTAADKTRVLLDVHGKGIVVVKSVPADVQML